jgi:methylenetetrahydrofolate--tRNA-(uracil-5-)-methyltransferase
MRPNVETGAHKSAKLAELVCSNSLGSKLPDRASGILKNELTFLNSLLVNVAEECALPAGTALAVDRELFSTRITEAITNHPRIELVREEVKSIPDLPTIVASGPLTSPELTTSIRNFTGEDSLYFFDAISPIISVDEIDREIVFTASRYQSLENNNPDYINCPFNEQEYYQFVHALLAADRLPLTKMESDILSGVNAGHYFEGCLPVEVIAERGPDTLAFGPMRPVGLKDPRSGKRPFAVVQLRQDNLIGSMYNLVGFQTNLKYPEQKRVFRMIPGLERAEFLRYGQMHRNTFIASPRVLRPTLQAVAREDLFFAGQITGVEGYLGNIATGLLAGLNIERLVNEKPLLTLPAETMLGSLCYYITHADMKDFQPMKSNLGILPVLLDPPRGKRERAAAYSARSAISLEGFVSLQPV